MLRSSARVTLIRVSSHLAPGLAFVFDMDGVLVHSMPLHTEAWEEYLRKLGIEAPDLESRMHGKRNAELVADLIGPDLGEDTVFEHGAAKERLWREMMLARGVERYQVRGLKAFLDRYDAVPKAIGTNAEPANIEFVMKHFELEKYFSVVVDGHQVSRPKPFPDIYLKCAELLGFSPANCIVFEDSPTGVKAARAAGMRVVGVATTPTHFSDVHLEIENFESPELESWLTAQSVLE